MHTKKNRGCESVIVPENEYFDPPPHTPKNKNKQKQSLSFQVIQNSDYNEESTDQKVFILKSLITQYTKCFT